MNRPLVLLAAPAQSYRLGPYLSAAARLGLRALVVSEGEHSLVSEVASGLRVSLHDPAGCAEQVLTALQGQPVAAVLGLEDSSVEAASRIARALGLSSNDPDAARLTWRKDLARARLAQAGLPVPAHRVLQLGAPLTPQAAGFGYPAVLKPLCLSGSRGVIRVNDAVQLEQAAARIARLLANEPRLTAHERSHALLEAYVPGMEVALEGLLQNGRLHMLALFDKPEPLEGPYFEESYYTTPSRLPPATQAVVQSTVQAACAAYGLMTGPVHAELRVHGGACTLLEVAARSIGGDCARLLDWSCGQPLEELVLRNAMGQPPPEARTDEGLGVLMIPIGAHGGVLRRVEGVLAAQAIPGVEAVFVDIREGNVLTPLPEGASYLGFIFACAPTAAQAEAALRAAHACLRIVTAPVLPLAVSAGA
jgi:biotin carboxylase